MSLKNNGNQYIRQIFDILASSPRPCRCLASCSVPSSARSLGVSMSLAFLRSSHASEKKERLLLRLSTWSVFFWGPSLLYWLLMVFGHVWKKKKTLIYGALCFWLFLTPTDLRLKPFSLQSDFMLDAASRASPKHNQAQPGLGSGDFGGQ